MRNIFNYIILIFLGITTLGVLVFAFLYLWPTKIAEYHTPYQIHPTTVEAGNTIFYVADYCKYQPIPATVNRTIVDGTVVFLPTTQTNLEVGCKKTDIPILVPLNTPPGRYHIDITLVYKINFVRDVTYKIRTEEFTVTNPCLTKTQTCN